MPPPNTTKSSQIEGRIAFAIDALKQGQFTSIRGAAKAYDVPRSSLQSRVHKTPARYDSRPTNRKLTDIESQHLLSGYYLWINVAYHLDLILYDKWRICSFKNGRVQVL